MPTTLGSAQLTAAVWSVLVAGAALAPWIGGPSALLASFALAVFLTIAFRPDVARGRFVGVPTSRVAWILLLASVSGYASYPAWTAAIATVGLGLGLQPLAAAHSAGGFQLALSQLVLAPVFEETLYRERWFLTLAPRLGACGAIVVASALFALPHLEPWAVLGTFLVGLALGAVYWATGSLVLCVGLHSGLNLAGWVCGSPPVQWALTPAAAWITGTLALVAGGALTRPSLAAMRRWRHA